MNGLQSGASPAGQMYVRALYDYQADDPTSLSFSHGDVIQVITQLESGWWDGVVHGVRGWFPSNYCAVMHSNYDDGTEGHDELDAEHEELGDEFPEHEMNGAFGQPIANGNGPAGAAAGGQEEAAFWVPQATPDGRLFYFNTLTGDSKMELPLEAPTSPDETGPLERANVFVPEQTRPPPNMGSASTDLDGDGYVSELDETTRRTLSVSIACQSVQ